MSIKVSAISLATVDGLVESNYQRALRLAEIAMEGKPDIVLLPEAFAAGYCGADLAAYAETRDSQWLSAFRGLSRKGDCMIVFGYLEKVEQGIMNGAMIYDRGEEVGVHYKHSLWPDDNRPYRDERTLMLPGPGIEVFDTRFGRMGVLICWENWFDQNWDQVAAGHADFVLSPYNC